ncbi:MAG: cytochrome c family protein [Woeseiaceae bacterium]
MTTQKKSEGFVAQLGFCVTALFYVLFAWHQWWAGVSPRLIRGSEQREMLHHAHLSLGATLFILLVLSFLAWLLLRGTSFSKKLKKAFSNSAMTAITLFFISSFLAILTGLAQAWAKDEKTPVLGVFDLPHFLDWSWGTSGYMHSALSSICVTLFAGIAFVFLFTKLRRYLKPGYAVAALLLLHLLINLPKPPSMHPIAAFGSYVMTPFFYLTALAVYSWAYERRWVYWPVFGLFTLFFLYLPYFAFKVLPPWHANAAAEIVLVEPKEALVALRARDDIFPDEASLAAASSEASWCMQCHNVAQNDEHLLGPNLDGVFNRQAGTATGYGRYSEAMVAAGLDGTFWSRDNLTKYLTDGNAFIPGNLMNQQTDLSDPAKMKQVLDYLEYISAE